MAYRDRGISTHNNTDLKKALADFDQAVHLNGTLPEAFENRGETLVRLNQPDARDRQFLARDRVETEV